MTKDEKVLFRMACYQIFKVEREYLEMIAQKESKYREYVLTLYNDILLAESLVIESTTD